MSERLNRLRAAGQNPLLADNDPSARRAFYEAVYAVLQETLWATACSTRFQILRTAQEQEDAIQSALIHLFKITLRCSQHGKIRWAEPDEVLIGYFTKIARRVLAKERNKIGNRLSRTNALIPDSDVPQVGSAPDADFKDAVETLVGLVENEVDRFIILHRCEEVPYEEISHRLKTEQGCEISVAALRQRFSRARDDLRAKLSARDTGD